MKQQTSFQRTLAFIVIGIGLIAVGVAAMTLLTLRHSLWSQAGRTAESSAVPAQADYPAPDLILNDLDGNPRSLSDYLGQVALVNMWAT
ncbi:MAG: hypothetical protein A3K41_12445 [Chloroflexi bacterium RIFOXYD12_FULL_57_15]|nr:MAG: hypothetical protein A3K41_12445 [Chloroflexi bacterium RIFOXYD12_FULL_57_15]